MIQINRAKAESIVIDRLRIDRAAVLLELDTAYMRALESGADTSKITAQKTALRDLTSKDLSQLSLERLSQLTLEEALSL